MKNGWLLRERRESTYPPRGNEETNAVFWAMYDVADDLPRISGFLAQMLLLNATDS